MSGADLLDFLRTSPVFLLALTVAAYQIGCVLRDRTGGHPLAQPVLIAIVLVVPVVRLLHIAYADYRSGTAFLSFLLGPATVALAVPLHREAHRLKGLLTPLFLAISVGAAVSAVSAALLVRALGGSDVLARTAAPKASTTPVAIAVADKIGGIGPLAAILAVLAGMLGAVLAPALLTALRVHDPRARGLATGAVSHGIGTSRLLHEDQTEGAFSALSMGLTALAISIVAPIVATVLL